MHASELPVYITRVTGPTALSLRASAKLIETLPEEEDEDRDRRVAIRPRTPYSTTMRTPLRVTRFRKAVRYSARYSPHFTRENTRVRIVPALHWLECRRAPIGRSLTARKRSHPVMRVESACTVRGPGLAPREKPRFLVQLVHHSRPPARRLYLRGRSSGKTRGGNRRNKKGAKERDRKSERRRER